MQKKNTTNKANTQASHSCKSHDVDHQGFCDILGEIHCVTLRCCLNVKDTPLLQAWWDHQTQGCKTEGTLKTIIIFFPHCLWFLPPFCWQPGTSGMQMFLGSTASFNQGKVSYWACDLTFNEQNRGSFQTYIHITLNLYICTHLDPGRAGRVSSSNQCFSWTRLFAYNICQNLLKLKT